MIINRIHFAVVLILNFILVLKMIDISWEGNDKAIIAVIFGYSILILINSIAWLVFKILKKRKYIIYKTTTIGLIGLFIPTIIVASIY